MSQNLTILERTFLHLPGVGLKTERQFWDNGIRTWDDLEEFYLKQPTLFPDLIQNRRLVALRASREALARSDAEFFASRLPAQEHYRIATTFPDDTAFLDIETTGLSTYYDHVTVVGVSRADRYACFVAGSRDDEWRVLLEGAKCLVTFNGTMFDLKFIAKTFTELTLPSAHVDLRFLGRRVSLVGGQKEIEKTLGIAREDDIQNVKGENAALLWFDYKSGDIAAGHRLVQYNHADVEGMKLILDEAIARLERSGRLPSDAINGTRFASKKSFLKFSSSRATGAKNEIYVPKYKGRKGPLVDYADLATDAAIGGLRVVGIDLTGSARRPTGWSLLDGCAAETRLLSTDKEIIVATVGASPNVVSIDSPLSLPKGRRSVLDTDPGREKFGIMRECERALKRRGVNVYPCLIPSMQSLTKRGIRLATHLRSLGFPVIESYPGAAQDIMNIPRKRASLTQLKDGLGHFGVTGPFLTQDVSHDEVDAITSAVVGVFHWAGKFEGLGNEDEEYLIIPDLHRKTDDWRDRRVVGISGPIAAGKTTAAKFLEKKGYVYGRYSQVLAGLLEKKGRKADRDSMQELGDRIHRRPGQRWLSRQLLKQFPSNGFLVVDGLRWPEDHAFWAEHFGPAFCHLHIEAEEEIRKKRYVAMGNSAAAFKRAVGHHVEQQIPRLRNHADAIIRNNGSRDAFTRAVTKAISSHFSEREASCRSQSS